jgi:hypothetical protein
MIVSRHGVEPVTFGLSLSAVRHLCLSHNILKINEEIPRQYLPAGGFFFPDSAVFRTSGPGWATVEIQQGCSFI